MKNLKSFKLITEHAQDQYSFFSNLEKIKSQVEELLNMDREEINNTLSGVDSSEDGHAWAVDHISTSADDIDEVYNFLKHNKK